MTPRKDIFFIDLNEPPQAILSKVVQSDFSHIVVCKEGLENAVGLLHRNDLLKPALTGASLDINGIMRTPLYVPDIMTIPHLLDNFRKVRAKFAIIVNEYGDTEGIVTLNDVLSAIVGEFPSVASLSDPEVVQRDDGSWLVDGGISISRLKSLLNINQYLPGEEANNYNTLGGFIIAYLERIPSVADYFDYAGWRFEIVDIDNASIDKVLINRR